MQQNQNKFGKLRTEFPFFVYEGYNIHRDAHSMQVRYFFNLSGKIKFEPKLSIGLEFPANKSLPEVLLHNLVFHIGMSEMISYWKATCSPKIIIKPFCLEPNALAWWKHLFFHGLGEFFHTNGIFPDYNEFLSIECEAGPEVERSAIELRNAGLIPVGGGKDSVVTLDLLTAGKMKVVPFFLNPNKAALNVSVKAGFQENQSIVIKRTIDPELLRMNKLGFLNGHTPFSALLAFYSLIAASITGTKHILLSNESSANEPTIPGSEINHQYSKSFAFESGFREYCSKYISDDFNYFSFLRPLNELQIAALFSGLIKYHLVFRSCNAGSKAGIWCGNCPKCLFTFIILSPFIEPGKLEKIFGHNLLDNTELIYYFDQLCGLELEKPFDCIGTIDEVNAALHTAISQYHDENVPALLRRYKLSSVYKSYNDNAFSDLLTQFNSPHFISGQLLHILKTRLNERIS